MCMGSSQKAPAPPPVAPEAAQAPTTVSRNDPGSADRRRRALAGMSSTILTGSRGIDTPAATATKTLLGQ